MDERDAEFATALGKAWQYIKSDGSFTSRELTEFTNQMDSSLCRQVLRAIIQTAWQDYGGKEKSQ
jgi:hypothetical protein